MASAVGFAAFLVGTADPSIAWAATLYVANNGLDSPACGAKSEPCRSISAAIDLAQAGDRVRVGPGVYGDLNADGDFDDDGDENSEPCNCGDFGCNCMITLSKPITLESVEGASSTIIDHGLPIIEGSMVPVSISANDVTFGSRNRGFHVTGRALFGVVVDDLRRDRAGRRAHALQGSARKAQGSEFEQVLLVIPERRALLTRELVYTAMTRSRGKLTLFVQTTREEHPLAVARRRSALLARNSALLGEPLVGRRLFEPEPGVQVQSKVEYLIFATLARARAAGRLSFAYEHKLVLPIDGEEIPIKTDFTIEVGGRRFFWEHLGMLDTWVYGAEWERRRKSYAAAGLEGALVTTDDLGGLIQERLDQVVDALVDGQLAGEAGRFSGHHYRLY